MIEKDVFYLNDFFDLLYEKDIENPNFASYCYFLNGHNDVGVASPSLATGFCAGLQFNRMRCYNPNLGRFIQKDVLFYYSPQNLYTYSFNLPLIYSDPFGLMPPWLWTWVQLKLPPPGGWAWEVISCDNPVSNSDCQELCLTGSLCEGCCRKLYEDRWNDPGFDECLKGCGSQVIIYQ